ncbi:MAG: FAD-dependent oxidoreductase, partial [Fuerstiella sp.]
MAGSLSPSFAGAEKEHAADIVIIGGGLGGCAAAIGALRNGLKVVMTEATDWIGGQLTSQGVPPDEHHLIETTGANQSYRELRSRIRKYYSDNYPLTDVARKNPRLNPGNGNVSRLCAEPRVSLAVLEQWLAPFEESGQLVVLHEHVATAADVDGDRVLAVSVRSTKTGDSQVLRGTYFVDATELGDVLPLTNTEFVTGSEARSATNELHAGETANADNQQSFTMCFAVDHLRGENHTIDRPEEYAFWRDFVPQLTPPWPGKLLDLTYTHPRSGKPKRLGFDPNGGKSVDGTLNLWTYRRMIDRSLFEPSRFAGDISLINWPQNDYLLGNLVGVSDDEASRHIARAKQLSLSLLYWLQTEAPRPDGGTGFPGLRLLPDLMGTQDGLAKAPYVRESRRIQAEFTVLEEHVGRENRSIVTG